MIHMPFPPTGQKNSLYTVVFRVCCVTENGAGRVLYSVHGYTGGYTKPNKKTVMTSFHSEKIDPEYTDHVGDLPNQTKKGVTSLNFTVKNG